MRYAIFSDIHANLEALEAVLTKIDEIAKEDPIDAIWFLGDLVGYGPDPNECIVKLRERTDVIIAGNHDWAAVGKIDLEDFSAAARISAEWTAKELTEEHRSFLTDLPERLEKGDCTLVHGSPYGPLWEYLTSEVLAERSFKYFSSRYCFVGHTHVPVIFQQPVPVPENYDEAIADEPTLPLAGAQQNSVHGSENGSGANEENDETVKVAAIAQSKAESAYADPLTGQSLTEIEANLLKDPAIGTLGQALVENEDIDGELTTDDAQDMQEVDKREDKGGVETAAPLEDKDVKEEEHEQGEEEPFADAEPREDVAEMDTGEDEQGISSEEVIRTAEEQTNSEIEELLALLGLTQSMISVTNEMFAPPEGHWDAPEGNRFIINPGGVGQPRDGDPRAAFMIYDSERGFEFYRVPYAVEKTQEKIIKAGLPQYLALRLAYGR